MLLIYFLGIITGFYYSPFSHNLKSLIFNILPLILVIVFKEFVRYILIFKGRFSKVHIIIITVLFVFIDVVTVINMYEFTSALLIFTFIGEVCIRSIYNNCLQSIISYNTGPFPSIVYRIILDCYVYLVPIMPNIGVYLTVVVNVLLPVLLLLKLNKLHFNYKNISKKKVSISKKYITIFISIVFVILISLVSGIFKYKIIAVASNSMLPTIERGYAVIYEKISSVNDLKEGDVLVFMNDNIIYIHRIVEISNKNKEIIIYTKGDNNTMVDSFTTTEKEIVDRVVQKVKYIGYPTIWVSELF